MNENKAVAIFGSSQTEPDSADWIDAERVGARCAAAGLAVVTGGYGGTMEAASKGATQAGGHAIGVTAPDLFPGRSGANPFVTRTVEAAGLGERIGVLTDLTSGAIVLPGSIGTAAELAVAWNLNHIGRRNDGTLYPTVAVGDDWRDFRDLVISRLGAFDGGIEIAANADEAVEWLLAQPEIHSHQGPLTSRP